MEGPALNLSDPAVAATPLTSPSLVVNADQLQPRQTYAFQLSASDGAPHPAATSMWPRKLELGPPQNGSLCGGLLWSRHELQD